MSRILLSSLKYSHLKLSYASVATPSRALLKSILPCASCYISKCNYSAPVAEVKNHSRSEKAGASSAARSQAREHIEFKINKLDQHVKRLGRTTLREVESTIKAIENAGFISSTQSLMIVRSCGALLVEEKPETRTELVHKIWKMLKDFDVKLDISHYNALLRVYLENEHPFNPSDILRAIEDSGLEVNRVTCQRLINRYCRTGDIENATRILEHMRLKGMPINESVFNALISGHSEVGDMESAEGILSVMKESGLEPSAETYSLLMCGFIKNGNLEKVDELFKQCESKEVMFADKDYFDVIYAYAMYGYENEIDKVLQKIRRSAAYNHDAMNFTFKLLTANKPEIAYKILKSMLRTSRPDGSLIPVGNFFIAHLARCGAPVDEVLKYSRDMMKENLNPQALHIAVETALRFHQEELALSLLKEARDNNIFPIRIHYFWPLLVYRGKRGDIAELCEILVSMHRDFDMAPSRETIRTYVIPHILKNETDVGRILLDLKSCNISTPITAGAIIAYLLEMGKLKKAIEIANEYIAHYQPRVMRATLLNCLYKTSDVNSFVAILQDIISDIYWSSNREESETDFSKLDHRDFVGETIGLAVEKLLKNNRKDVAQELIQKVVEEGIGLNEGRIKFIQALVKDILPDEIANSLEKLSSDEFATPPVKEIPLTKSSMNSLDEKALERLYDMSKTKGDVPSSNVKRFLFLSYAKNRNLSKMKELKEEIESDGFVLNSTMLIYAMDAYIHHGELEEALKIYQRLCDDDPNFRLNPKKTLSLIESLVEHERYDEAIDLLKKRIDSPESDDIDGREEISRRRAAFKTLNRLAEKGDVEKTKELFDLLVATKLIKPCSYLMSPIIRAHLKREDYDGAMKEFKNCVETHKFTPYKSELARLLIEKEDAVRLQELVDLSSKIHGEGNSLSDLMIAFLESGRIKQAQKILETPGFRLRPDSLRFICAGLVEKEDAKIAKNLLMVTKNNALIDRELIYDTLLSIYSKQNDPENSISLWIEIQEENLQPSDRFLILLASILRRNNLDVPFVVPEEKGRKEFRRTPSTARRTRNSSMIDDPLQSDNTDKASGSASLTLQKFDHSEKLQQLLIENRYDDAIKFVKATKKLPRPIVLRELLSRAVEKGDIDFIKYLDTTLLDSAKKRYSLSNKILRTYMNAGRIDEHLSYWEKKLTYIHNKEELETFLSLFPRTTAVQLMIEHPEYKSRVEAFAEKCIAIDEKCSMQHVLFSFHLIKKNFEKADQIYNEHLKSSRLMIFGAVLSHVYQNSDPQVGVKLLSYLKERSDVDRALVKTYTNLIDTYIRMDEVEQAKKYFEEALTKIPIHKMSTRWLENLKATFSDKKINFPYTIPARKIRRTISNKATDSDSD